MAGWPVGRIGEKNGKKSVKCLDAESHLGLNCPSRDFF